MATTSDFYSLVAPHVPGVATPALDQAILFSAIDFCEGSRVWQSVMPAVSLVANQASYLVPVPTDANSVIIEELYIDDAQLKPKPIDWIRENFKTWMTLTGTPQVFFQMDQDNVTLVPMPDTAGSQMVMRVSFKPSITAATLPDILKNQYSSAIADGAIARLMATPGKSYTNPQLAAYHQQQFDEATSHAGIDKAKGFGRSRIRVRAHSF